MTFSALATFVSGGVDAAATFSFSSPLVDARARFPLALFARARSRSRSGSASTTTTSALVVGAVVVVGGASTLSRFGAGAKNDAIERCPGGGAVGFCALPMARDVRGRSLDARAVRGDPTARRARCAVGECDVGFEIH